MSKTETGTKRFNHSQPADWVAAWTAAAQREGKFLSQWMAEQCNAALPKKVLKSLSERPVYGRKASK